MKNQKRDGKEEYHVKLSSYIEISRKLRKCHDDLNRKLQDEQKPKMTYQQLADELNEKYNTSFSKTTVEQFEKMGLTTKNGKPTNNRTGIDAETLTIFADYYEKSVDYFVYEVTPTQADLINKNALSNDAVKSISDMTVSQKENLNELFSNGFIQNILGIMDKYQLDDGTLDLLNNSKKIIEDFNTLDACTYNHLLDIRNDTDPNDDDIYYEVPIEDQPQMEILTKYEALEFTVIAVLHKFTDFQKDIKDEVLESVVTKMMKIQMHYDAVKNVYDSMSEQAKAYYEFRYRMFNAPFPETWEDISYYI